MQILLRIDDEHGHHIVKKDKNNGLFSIEGHNERPENKNVTPKYFFPIDEKEVARLFAEQGKEWRLSNGNNS